MCCLQVIGSQRHRDTRTVYPETAVGLRPRSASGDVPVCSFLVVDHDFDVFSSAKIQAKQMRHCRLILMLCCPGR